MDFQDKVNLIAAVFGLVDKETGQPHFLTEEQRKASYMPYTVIPDDSSCVSICKVANTAYNAFLDTPPQDINEIITWRATYIALYDHCIVKVINPCSDVHSFLTNYDNSILYFHELLEKGSNG